MRKRRKPTGIAAEEGEGRGPVTAWPVLWALKEWRHGTTLKELSRVERNAGGGEYSEVRTSYGRLDPDNPIPGFAGAYCRRLLDWAYSNLLTNITRGLFAKFLVGTALGAVEGTRTEWDSFDLLYQGAKIEVKSSAYLQSWPQEKPSAIG